MKGKSLILSVTIVILIATILFMATLLQVNTVTIERLKERCKPDSVKVLLIYDQDIYIDQNDINLGDTLNRDNILKTFIPSYGTYDTIIVFNNRVKVGYGYKRY